MPRVVLVTGKEEFLSERTVVGVRSAVKTYDADAEFADSSASGLTLASLGEMAAPSLFSSTRCVVIRALETLPDECYDGILDYAAAPADDIALVLVHGGGAKGSGKAVGFLSAKGGCGKTTVATNLAAALAHLAGEENAEEGVAAGRQGGDEAAVRGAGDGDTAVVAVLEREVGGLQFV